MFIRDINFFHPGSLIHIKEFQYFKFSEIWSELFMLDPDPDLLPTPDPDLLPTADPDPGVKKATDPGYWIRISNTAS
jgi:hypothetical protein